MNQLTTKRNECTAISPAKARTYDPSLSRDWDELNRHSAGYLGGEPGHDMERRLDELHGHLQQHRHAEAAGADARDGQPAIAWMRITEQTN